MCSICSARAITIGAPSPLQAIDSLPARRYMPPARGIIVQTDTPPKIAAFDGKEWELDVPLAAPKGRRRRS
jgi:hypothetical protein